MKNKEYLLMLKNVKICDERVLPLENTYGSSFTPVVKAMISYANEPVFLDEYRVLSHSEILNASAELHVEFAKKKIIPLLDCCDNNFIVYHFDTDSWSMYNIIDDCLFFEKSTLEEFLV